MEIKIEIQRELAAEKIQTAAINNDVTDLEENLGRLCDGSDHDLSWLLAACQNNIVDFMREVLRVKPDVVWSKLNWEGDYAIHAACDREHIEILEVLLAVFPGLCYLKDKSDEFPLHTASKLGKVQVIQAILEACPECLDGQLTISKETALHLSVIHNTEDAFAVLMDRTLRYNPDILHFKDSQGNNVLHLATQHKRYKVLELLLEDNYRKGPIVRIHSKNSRGLTAWDIHSHNYKERNDEKISLLPRNAAKLSNQSIIPNSTTVPDDKQPLTTIGMVVLTFSSMIAGSAYTSIFNLDKANHVRYEGVGIREILFHSSQLSSVFYNFVYMTVAYTSSLVGIVISMPIITGWSFHYLAMPLFGFCAFFVSYATMMNERMPRFLVTLIPRSVKVTYYWLVWLYSLFLIILGLSVIWIGAKLYFCISAKAKSAQARV